MDQPTKQDSQLQQSDPDEINLLEYIYVLVKNKWWIIGAAVLGLVLGYVAAILKGPIYVTEAVIAAKENENIKTPNLSSFGAFSGIVASQLDISANPGLDKIDLILSSRKFSAELVERYNLFPLVMKMQNPKAYQKWFDTTKNTWNDSFVKPNILLVGAGLSSGFLKKEIKNGTMILKIASKDSTFSDTLLAKYLEYLNIYIKTSVQNDARENVSYLEKQLITIADPLLREKLQTMIANELEKEMMVSKESFKLIDLPIRSMQFKEKKLYPIVFGIMFFFPTITFILLVNISMNRIRTKREVDCINIIKKKLFTI